MCKEVSKYLPPSFERQDLYLGMVSLPRVEDLEGSRLQGRVTRRYWLDVTNRHRSSVKEQMDEELWIHSRSLSEPPDMDLAHRSAPGP